MNKLNRHGPFADGRGNALHASRPDIPRGEYSGKVRFQQIWRARLRPFAPQVRAGLDELFAVQRQASAQPGSVGAGAGHEEQVLDFASLVSPVCTCLQRTRSRCAAPSSASTSVYGLKVISRLASIREIRYLDMLSASPGPRTSKWTCFA